MPQTIEELQKLVLKALADKEKVQREVILAKQQAVELTSTVFPLRQQIAEESELPVSQIEAFHELRRESASDTASGQ